MRLKALLVSMLRRHLGGAKPAVPEAGVLLWNLFMQISTSRTYHMAGPNPLSHAEIEAFCRLYRWPLQSHHLEVIRALDDAWLEHAYRKMEGGKGDGQQGHTFDGRLYAAAQPMSAASFDAAFG